MGGAKLQGPHQNLCEASREKQRVSDKYETNTSQKLGCGVGAVQWVNRMKFEGNLAFPLMGFMVETEKPGECWDLQIH